MSKKNKDFDALIGNGTGLINPNSKDFQYLKEAIQKEANEMMSAEKMLIKIKGIRYRMESYLNNENPKDLIPVGKFLKELITAIKVSNKDFAEYIGIQNSNLSALFNGKRKINHDLALKLGRIFSIDPSLWLNLQNKLDLIEIHQKNQSEYEKYHLDDLLKKVG